MTTPETESAPPYVQEIAGLSDMLKEANARNLLLEQELERTKEQRNKAGMEARAELLPKLTTTQQKLAAAKTALAIAVNTVEWASIDPVTKEELPWYRAAKAALKDTAASGWIRLDDPIIKALENDVKFYCLKNAAHVRSLIDLEQARSTSTQGTK